MRNGRFVLPVGNEEAQLYLFVTRFGDARVPRVFVNSFVRYKDRRIAILNTCVYIGEDPRMSDVNEW